MDLSSVYRRIEIEEVGFRYKADANDWLKQITRSGVDTAPPKRGEWAVSQQFSQWICKADIAETTRATRNHTWQARVSDKWGELQVTKVTPPDVKSWVADMASGDVGAPTIENALGVLRMVRKDAVDDGRLIRNLCDGINVPKRQHKSRAYLAHEQVEQLAAAAGEVDGLVVRLLAYAGLRWGELAALTVGSVSTYADLFDSDLDALADCSISTVRLRWGHQVPTATVKPREKTYPVRWGKLPSCTQQGYYQLFLGRGGGI